MKRKSWLGAFVVVALLMAGLSRVAVGSDPEPWIDPNLQYRIDPGPGWPEGWVEPAAPTGLTDEAREEFAEAQGLTGPGEVRPERLEFRVLSPMPEWTKEYPYDWKYWIVYCGATGYAYFYPDVEVELIYEVFGETFSPGGLGVGNCEFSPITSIQHIPKQTDEEKHQFYLSNLVDRDVQLAQGNLDYCDEEVTDGTYDNIYVCFNYGDASDKFDVPAYLDVSVGRVRVPIRFVSEMMGAEVSWEQSTETVTIHFPAVSREVVQPQLKPGYKPVDMWNANQYTLNSSNFTWTVATVSQPERAIVLRVSSDVAVVDGQEVRIDAPPVVLPPGRTMVPVRFVAEAMGAKVYWVGSEPIFLKTGNTLGGTNQVHIFTPFHPYFAAPDWFLETRAQRF